MITRRSLIAATAVAPVALSQASAQTWKSAYPELTFALVPAENAAGVIDRWTPFVNYLTKEIGTKVTLRVANDYAAVIEGQRAGNVHIANYGASSFSRARIIGVKTEAVLINENADRSTGYYSVFYVLASSAYKKIEDLKGKNLGLVDPNSTSGNNMPRFVLNEMKIKPEEFFSKVVYTGSHENAVIALAQGQVDVCANAWTNKDDSTLKQMLTKGMLKFKDGKPMQYSDFRIIKTSPAILNGPYALLESLPPALKTAIIKAFKDAPKKAKAEFDRLTDGQSPAFKDTTTAEYNDSIKLVRFVDSLRKS
jgi:phosphonate transport system substrate-binding protein